MKNKVHLQGPVIALLSDFLLVVLNTITASAFQQMWENNVPSRNVVLKLHTVRIEENIFRHVRTQKGYFQYFMYVL